MLLIRRLAQYVSDKDGGPWVHGAAHHRCTDAGVLWSGIVLVDGHRRPTGTGTLWVDERRARGVGRGGAWQRGRARTRTWDFSALGGRGACEGGGVQRGKSKRGGCGIAGGRESEKERGTAWERDGGMVLLRMCGKQERREARRRTTGKVRYLGLGWESRRAVVAVV